MRLSCDALYFLMGSESMWCTKNASVRTSAVVQRYFYLGNDSPILNFKNPCGFSIRFGDSLTLSGRTMSLDCSTERILALLAGRTVLLHWKLSLPCLLLDNRSINTPSCLRPEVSQTSTKNVRQTTSLFILFQQIRKRCL